MIKSHLIIVFCRFYPGKSVLEMGSLFLQEMGSVEKGKNNRLFYLALPPSVFINVTSMIKVLLLS